MHVGYAWIGRSSGRVPVSAVKPMPGGMVKVKPCGASVWCVVNASDFMPSGMESDALAVVLAEHRAAELAELLAWVGRAHGRKAGSEVIR